MSTPSLAKFYQHLQGTNQLFQHQFHISLQLGNEETSDKAKKLQLDSSGDEICLEFYATSATIPGVEIGSADVHMYGTPFRVPGIISYSGDWSLNVRCDNKLEIHKRAKAWLNDYSSLAKSGGGANLGKIGSSTARVQVLNHDMQPNEAETTSIKLQGVFPQNVGDITVDHSASNSLATFSLAVKYQYWFYESDKDPFGG